MWAMQMLIDKSAMTVEAAAAFIGVTTGRVRQLLRSGDLLGEKIGARLWLVDQDSAKEYRDTQRKPGPKSR